MYTIIIQTSIQSSSRCLCHPHPDVYGTLIPMSVPLPSRRLSHLQSVVYPVSLRRPFHPHPEVYVILFPTSIPCICRHLSHLHLDVYPIFIRVSVPSSPRRPSLPYYDVSPIILTSITSYLTPTRIPSHSNIIISCVIPTPAHSHPVVYQVLTPISSPYLSCRVF